MTHLRVATYNVHKCLGLDRRIRVERIRRVIEEIEPDLLATQEILKHQADQLSEDLALPHWFGVTRQHANEDYGNATFTRMAVATAESFDLTVANREPRQCLRIQTTGIDFFNIHLGTSLGERRKQASLLMSDRILQRPDLRGNRIVVGDFNEWVRGLVTRLLEKTLRSADYVRYLRTRVTYPGVLPFLHLDHVYYDSSFELLAMRLHRTRTALLASDHLPLVAEFVSMVN